MARTKEIRMNIEPLLRFYGKDHEIQQFVKEVGIQEIIQHYGLEKFLARLTSTQRKE